MQEERIGLDNPVVIPRSGIPVSRASSDGAVEVRSFGGHEWLRSLVPGSVSMSWTCAHAGQSSGLRSHARPSLLVVLHGRARLTGQVDGAVEEGDVVTLPPGAEYGFTEVGPSGLRALHVVFNEDDEDAAEERETVTLEGLLAHNEVRAKMALESRYFKLLRGDALASPENRGRLRDGIRVFSDAFQIVLFTRQATCRDEDYFGTFRQHLVEELGHNELLTVPENRRAPSDPILRSTSTWFCHQMLTLDNLGKAALIHLVLETAGYHFHTLAAPVLGGDVSAEYFHIHAEADDEHKDLVYRFLENQHPETYRRLRRIVDEGWDMFDAMTERMVHLVELERLSS